MQLTTACLLLCAIAQAMPISNGWTQTAGLLEPAASMTIRFVLERARPSALEEALLDISNPDSDRFRQYLTDAELSDLVRPKAGAAEAVEGWVRDTMGQEVSVERSKHGDYILASAPAAGMAHAFEGLIDSVAVFRHNKTSRSIIRGVASAATPTSLVPSRLREHVRAILDLIELLPVPPRHKNLHSEEPGEMVEPPVLYKEYGPYENGGRTATSQGVAMFEQAEFNPKDLAAFQSAYKLPEVKFKINGPNSGGYFGEGSLDTQLITATGRAVPSWWIARDAFDMLAWCEQVLNMSAPPSVVSISWGSGESNYPTEHMHAGSDCFQKMGVQGISVFTASGDDGTGKQGVLWCSKFDTNWPASCPYVTTVGGTYLESGTEKGWAYSGGGFSAVFSRPSWQNKVVAAYKQSGKLPDSRYYSPEGCAKPDIAALSTNYQTYTGGIPAGSLMSGTSAASPVYAGLVAVINDLLVASGKPPVGFINPVLYAAAESTDFLGFDVVSGNNKHSWCSAGFPAIEGWDAVTGFGTPKFQKLKGILMPEASVVV